ncbi:MAG TPA: hypothetical protein PKI09_16780 [Dermatophilaceae bacterium]|nr:MAG: hypothetical protein BWY91_02286 [bacterium ADurb.BinA028]HOA59635.1 hypothetical protein [Dermatophilaceae bacterium]
MRVSLVTDVATAPMVAGLVVFLVLGFVVVVGLVILAVLLVRRSRR